MDIFKKKQKNYRFPEWFSSLLEKIEHKTGDNHTKILMDSTCKAHKVKQPKKPKHKAD